MKLIFIIAFVFFNTLIGACVSDQKHTDQKSNNTKSNYDDQSRSINLIDGKRASIPEIEEGFKKDRIEIIEGTNDSRYAILHYGEKYRYGVHIMVTKKKEDHK
jgi:hypothetical protein